MNYLPEKNFFEITEVYLIKFISENLYEKLDCLVINEQICSAYTGRVTVHNTFRVPGFCEIKMKKG